MGLCRLRKQMQRRRRLLLPTLRRRHAALRDPRVPELRLRNNAPCQSSCRFTWLSLHLCRAHSLVVTVTDSLVHGSLARAGKVKSQTPKVEKQEKKKTPKGRAKKRMLYNRRFVILANAFLMFDAELDDIA
jgi:ribosomal protein S30